MDANIIKDLNFHKSVVDIIEDKMIFKEIIFDNAIIMATYMVDWIKRNGLGINVKEVAYDNATSSIVLTVDPDVQSIDDIKTLIEQSIGFVLRSPSTVQGLDNCNAIIMRKLNSHPEYGICTTMQWMQHYSTYGSTFALFKVLNIGNGEYVIKF